MYSDIQAAMLQSIERLEQIASQAAISSRDSIYIGANGKSVL